MIAFPLTAQFAPAESAKAFVVLEMLVVIPLLGFLLSYLATLLPMEQWQQRAVAIVPVILLIGAYGRYLKS